MNISAQNAWRPFWRNTGSARLFRASGVTQGGKNQTIKLHAATDEGQQLSIRDHYDNGWKPEYFRPVCRLKSDVAELSAAAVKPDLGGRYNYTKVDAAERLSSATLSMDRNAAASGGELMWLRVDFDAVSARTDSLEQSADYMASRYAVERSRIDASYSGEAKTSALKSLDALMDVYAKRLAERFAGEAGDVFEQYGVTGEKQALYDSVLTGIREKTTQYTTFLQSGRSFGDTAPADAWLKNDGAWLASELRKAVQPSGTAVVERPADSYTLAEAQNMRHFILELTSYSKNVAGSTKAVLTGNESEESLGMKLAELSLKARVFTEHADISSRGKAAVEKSVRGFIKSSVEKEQAFMDEWSQRQLQSVNELLQEGWYTRALAEKENAEIKTNFTLLDERAVYAVIDRVQTAYGKTGDAGRALLEGAVFGQSAFAKKVQDSRFQGVGRYEDGEVYWNNFFVNTDKTRGAPFDGYLQKQSGLDCIVAAWNDFMEKVTTDSDARMAVDPFSVTA